MLADEVAGDTAAFDDNHDSPPPRARTALAKRIADIVCLPSSEITPQERHMAGDVLFEMLREADPPLRLRVSRRLCMLVDPPPRLLRMLAKDSLEIAAPILENSIALGEADLSDIARTTTAQHRKLIAAREEIGESIAEVLAGHDEAEVVRALLLNDGAKLSNRAVDILVAASRETTAYCRLLLRRLELRPAQALAMFWWCGPEERKRVFERFAVPRTLLQEAAADIFAMAQPEDWADPPARKALQFIERRQRNRAAIEKSPYDSLEAAIEAASVTGMNREVVEEISYLSGVKPATGAQIFTDLGGEGIAVLCKATGLKRPSLDLIWRALRRDADEDFDPVFQRLLQTYDSLSNDKAQTVLRYWNWSLTSAVSPSLMNSIQQPPELDDDSQPESARTAALVFSGR